MQARWSNSLLFVFVFVFSQNMHFYCAASVISTLQLLPISPHRLMMWTKEFHSTDIISCNHLQPSYNRIPQKSLLQFHLAVPSVPFKFNSNSNRSSITSRFYSSGKSPVADIDLSWQTAGGNLSCSQITFPTRKLQTQADTNNHQLINTCHLRSSSLLSNHHPNTQQLKVAN